MQRDAKETWVAARARGENIVEVTERTRDAREDAKKIWEPDGWRKKRVVVALSRALARCWNEVRWAPRRAAEPEVRKRRTRMT